MKKIILTTLVAIVIFAFSSCTKDYTCECTLSFTDGSASSTVTYTINDAKKKDAENACTAYAYTTTTSSYSCDLK